MSCRKDISASAWSEEGISTDIISYDEERKSYNIVCSSAHLTSFAVLLDVNDALSVSTHTSSYTCSTFKDWFTGSREPDSDNPDLHWVLHLNRFSAGDDCILHIFHWVRQDAEGNNG